MGRLRSIRRRLSSFVALDPQRRGLLLAAAWWLLVARAALLVVPFPRLARVLGTFVPPSDQRVRQAQSSTALGQSRIAEDVRWAVTGAARHVPFRAVCLPQAMAARMMLARRGVGSVLHFGAAKDVHAQLYTHAWLDAAGVEVTGYPIAKAAVEIACFV